MGTVSAMHPSEEQASILFIDDEPRVLKSMRAMFRRDFRVFLANSGQEALDLLANQNVDVVVSDQRMPNMTGVEVLTQIKAAYPRTVRVLLTGYADLEAIEASLNEAQVFRYLMKPSTAEQIRTAVEEGLTQRDAPQMAEVIQLNAGDARGQGDENSPESLAAMPDAVVPERRPEVTRPRSSSTPVTNRDVVLLGGKDLEEDLLAAVNRKQLHYAHDLDHLGSVLNEHRPAVVVVNVDIVETEKIAAEIKARYPHLLTVVASDRSDAMLLIQMINSGLVFRFLVKPIQSGRLTLTLRAAFEYANEHQGDVYAEGGDKLGLWARFTNWLAGVRG